VRTETEFEDNILRVEIAWRKARSPSVQHSSAYEEENGLLAYSSIHPFIHSFKCRQLIQLAT